jgi:mannose/fructose-specific phosphotransferase system component IIA
MKFSKKISEAMESKPGRLSQIKALGFYTTSHRVEKIKDFFRALTSVEAVSKDVVFGRVNDITVFFIQPEDEVVEKILAIPDKKKIETSEKVLVKMVALRIEKIFKMVEGLKSCDEMSDLFRIRMDVHKDTEQMLDKILSSASMEKSCRDDVCRMKDILCGVAWLTASGIKFNNIVGSERLPYPHRHGFPWKLEYFEIDALNNCIEVFNRPDVTPEIVAQAWRLYSVGSVMKG